MHNQTSNTPSRNEIDAHALRVFAGNGFGDAPIGDTEPHKLLDTVSSFTTSRAKTAPTS